MRKRRGIQNTYNVGATPVLIAPANPQRRSIIIDISSGPGINITLNQQPQSGNGIGQLSVNDFMELTYEFHGDLVMSDFWAIQGSGFDPTFHPAVSVVGAALSGATTGDKLDTGIIPAPGGELVSATLANFTGAPTVALQLIRASTTYNLAGGFTATTQVNLGLGLLAGDKVQWDVTALVAASVFDATITWRSNSGLILGGTSLVTVWATEDCGFV